jgi:hypothetical protein
MSRTVARRRFAQADSELHNVFSVKYSMRSRTA